MAAVEVTISGVLFDKLNRTMQNVVLIGEASLTGLGVGGGPMPPGQGGGQPPGTPTFPIAGYPDFPYPSQPIYRPGYPGGSPPPSFPGMPPMPTEPPPEGEKPPSADAQGPQWCYDPDVGWYIAVVPQGGGGKPQPGGPGMPPATP